MLETNSKQQVKVFYKLSKEWKYNLGPPEITKNN